MDQQQLKLLAGRVRGLLEQKNHPIGHSASLDLIAALPGLRNWPEVQAFPDRVAKCELDDQSASRLAFRLNKRFGIEIAARALLTELAPPGLVNLERVPVIWPAGPVPGVYLTTSQLAIDALMASYEEATDGALVYAERAGSHWEGSIDLGDNGLWSHGIERLPSGTLLVVGPLELDQQSWEETGRHVEMACLHAHNWGHRVAVLVETPSPQTVCEDVDLAVRGVQGEGDANNALMGLVSGNGEMEVALPFAKAYAAPVKSRCVTTMEAFPSKHREAVRSAVTGQKSGLLLFGSATYEEHPGIELVEAVLAITQHAGPVARIMPRTRSTPSKDWLVPDGIRQIPYLPSVQSAFAQGYRRMIINPRYTGIDVLTEYGDQVLFMGTAYDVDVTNILMSVNTSHSRNDYSHLLQMLIAIVGIGSIRAKHQDYSLCDLYVRPGLDAVQAHKLAECDEFINANRVVRLEDEFQYLLATGEFNLDDVDVDIKRSRRVRAMLKERGFTIPA